MLLEGIETLLVLAQEGTMSRAGNRLYISQSAVSKRIAKLESTLGKKLISPSGRLIKLTPDALALIENVGPSFSELRGLIFEQQTIEDHSIIKIDCSETLVAGYLGEAFGHYIQKDKNFTITTHHTPVIIENVRSGQATIGCCAGYLAPHHGLHYQHLLDERFRIVAATALQSPPEYLLVNDLKNPSNLYQAAILQKAGITPLMEMDSYTAAAQLALGGVAPALVPESIISALKIDPIYCHHFDFLDQLTRPVHIIYRAKNAASPRVKTIIETIADAVATAI
ncbi:LysR family transcriptional regulator [Photobacterium phosphoreum]|uniref:LysR family transcriptional regulator n=1 Tax=Photobacterium phosphoreum TaxID=659 RepID=A0AAW4ZPF9_PHOPO|nr:LysR family transcriptional regulator [Photobacterium phosphoreum]MCD9469689.1 LysR family transcriptional regulator [Photobacterium phosphoreum]MCD9473627.1 LysR family transcriptional regulator [Photobacterium phosphoreum]MCD9489670.1 LysR family transcriptional regulator [Photobacterium phosphoreum]MCF2175182.1 LysR family transcriptional regulator [Photobacterium phosphoreum]MCF2188620.1 LysR family transcriptional regulator [Photobacterium phosphoreum]